MGKTKGDGTSHEATWGASQPAKQEWEDHNADAAREATEKENEQRAKEELKDNG